MALDKLVDSSQLDSDLTSIANAIRTKGGTSAQMAFPAGFVSAVQAIPSGTTPTGTKQISISSNGTTAEDVTNYASAEIVVNVPNTYYASDEGKVVSNGALVAQTSDTVTQNGTVDTTLVNSLTVNVSGGGGTDFGATDTNTLSEMFWALEHNQYHTGTVQVSSYFPANTESVFCDTGYVDNVRGIVIFNTSQPSTTSNSYDTYEVIGFCGLPSSAGADQSFSTVSSSAKVRNTTANAFFNTSYMTSRINSGKLYITPKYARSTNTYFQTGHTYRWIAWPYQN